MKSLEEIRNRIRKFRDERDWMQFHNPKNLACSISIEANELLEHFQWSTPEESLTIARKKKTEISHEIADVAVYLIELADNLGIDLAKSITEKMAHNEAKYPADKVRGSSKKYTEYKTAKRLHK
jgi:NTP pyrophosphatase (non-canonical NTP hydrolase)